VRDCYLNILFAKICHNLYFAVMSTMNISLPNSLKSFVDEQVDLRGFASSSEYVRELIRKDKDRHHLKALLLEGAGSKPSGPVDDQYYESLRQSARGQQKT
jgi:antitoxin ParD1/3/4